MKIKMSSCVNIDANTVRIEKLMVTFEGMA